MVVVGTRKAGLMYISGCCRNKESWSNVYIWLFVGTNKAGLMYISGVCRNKQVWSNLCIYRVFVGTNKDGLNLSG